MRKTAIPVVSGLLTVVLASSGALAGETSDLQRQIDELKAKVENLQAKKDSSSAPAAEKKSSWTDKVTLFGDFRYRHEAISEPHRETARPDRERERIRARLGLKARVNDEVDLTFRIATGNTTDPVSTNQTLGGNFTKKAVVLDQAFFDYHPDALREAGVPTHLLGGKMPTPFIAPGGSDLLWDGDLTPEGGALKLAPRLGDAAELLVNLGGFVVNEVHDPASTENNEDPGLFGAQAALKLKFDEKGTTYAMVGAGYFNYTHAEGKTTFGGAFGNTLDGTLYEYGYREQEGFVEVGFPVLDVPVTLYGDYVRNLDAGDEDTGYLVGVNVGRAREQWDWSVGYNYRALEKDAVLGAFTDSDSGGGGTDHKGHKFGAQLMVLKNVTVGATCFIDKVNISDDDATDRNADYHRLQLDVMFKF